MEFISAEEFLKPHLEVQRVFKEYFDRKEMLYTFNDNISYGEFIDKLEFIPNPVEGQLRTFIEDETTYKLEITQFEDGEWNLCLYKHGLRDIEISDMNLLQAYWKVACEIANNKGEI